LSTHLASISILSGVLAEARVSDYLELGINLIIIRGLSFFSFDAKVYLAVLS
jgi:hypothetical protein